MSTDHTAERVTDVIRQHADVVRGHDAVHPDRSACGGIGSCGLRRAEHDAEQEILDALTHAARGNRNLSVGVTRG